MHNRDITDLRNMLRDRFPTVQLPDDEVVSRHRNADGTYARKGRNNTKRVATGRESELDGICGADKPPAGDVAINSLLYVSHSNLDDSDYRHALLDIQCTAVVHNNDYGLTGVLLATRNHFAQFLEGPIEGIYQVMSGIMRDPRHYGIVIADTHPFNHRLFPSWRMACFSPNSAASRRIAPMLNRNYGILSPNEADTLIALMQSTVANFDTGRPSFEGDA